MKKLNRKGFTLVELIAVVVILSLIVGIGATAITEVIKNNKEKDYILLIKEIKSATESYYHECRYSDVPPTCDNNGIIKLGDLVTNGFLKGNSKLEDGSSTLVNPNNEDNIYNCEIKWIYGNGKFNIEDLSGGVCPKTEDYSG